MGKSTISIWPFFPLQTVSSPEGSLKHLKSKSVQMPSPKGSPVPNKPQIHTNPRERTHGYGPMGQKVHPQLIITSQRFKLVLRRYPISLMNTHIP